MHRGGLSRHDVAAWEATRTAVGGRTYLQVPLATVREKEIGGWGLFPRTHGQRQRSKHRAAREHGASASSTGQHRRGNIAAGSHAGAQSWRDKPPCAPSRATGPRAACRSPVPHCDVRSFRWCRHSGTAPRGPSRTSLRWCTQRSASAGAGRGSSPGAQPGAAGEWRGSREGGAQRRLWNHAGPWAGASLGASER